MKQVAYYKVHKRGINGEPEAKAAGTEQPSHATPEAAREWLIQQLESEMIDGEFDDFLLVPFDADNQKLDLYSETEIEQAKSDAAYLIENNKQLRQAYAGVIAARQLLAYAANLCNQIVDNTDNMRGDILRPHPMTKQVLMRSSTDYALRLGATAHGIMESLLDATLPWLKDQIKQDTSAETTAQMERFEAAKKAEDERRKLPVHLPTVVPFLGDVSRNRPVIMIGNASSLRTILRAFRTDALGMQLRTVHLSTSPDTFNDANLLLLDNCDGCARNSTTIERLFEKHLTPFLGAGPVELFLCDSLSHVGSTVIMGSTAASQANDVLKRLQRITRTLGCGTVLGLPMTTSAMTHEQYFSLLDYADLIFVTEVFIGDNVNRLTFTLYRNPSTPISVMVDVANNEFIKSGAGQLVPKQEV